MDIDLRLLRHARALAELGSFARAAKVHNITQPALSRSIQALEQRLGAQLFHRTRSGAELTDVGRLFMEQARDLLSRADDLSREVELFHGIDTAALVIGCGPYPAELVVAEAVGRTSRDRPGTRARMVVSDPISIVSMVGRRELDLAVAETTIVPDEADWLVTPLSRHQGYFVVRAGHPLEAIPDPALAQILAFPLVMTGRLPPRVLDPLLKRSPALGAALKAIPAIAVESLTMMKIIAAASDAVALLSLSAVADELAGGRLVALNRVEPWLHTQFGIVRLRRRTLSPMATAFLDHLQQVDSEVAALEAELAKRLAGRRKSAKRAVA